MYEAQLEETGLTKNEARIYEHLLRTGKTKPAQLSATLGLHRGYLYDALRRMEEKGFINQVLINNKKHYAAEALENVSENLRMKAGVFEQLVPELASLEPVQEASVEHHQGKRVFRTLLKDVMAKLKEGGELLLYGVDDNELMEKVEPIYLKQYLTVIAEQNITERSLIPKGARQLESENTEYKELPEQLIGATSYFIYADNLALYIDGELRHLILIRNKAVVESYKMQFEHFWELAE